MSNTEKPSRKRNYYIHCLSGWSSFSLRVGVGLRPNTHLNYFVALLFIEEYVATAPSQSLYSDITQEANGL